MDRIILRKKHTRCWLAERRPGVRDHVSSVDEAALEFARLYMRSYNGLLRAGRGQQYCYEEVNGVTRRCHKTDNHVRDDFRLTGECFASYVIEDMEKTSEDPLADSIGLQSEANVRNMYLSVFADIIYDFIRRPRYFRLQRSCG